MKKEIALDMLMKSVIVTTIVLIGMQYYFYRVRENNIQKANEHYLAQQALLEKGF